MTKSSVKPALGRIEEKLDQLVKIHESQNKVAITEQPDSDLEIHCNCDSITEESQGQDDQAKKGEKQIGE